MSSPLSLLVFLWEMENKSHLLLAVKTKHCSTDVLGAHQIFLFFFSPRPPSRNFCGKKHTVRLMSSFQLYKPRSIHSSRRPVFPHFPSFNPTQQWHFQWSWNMSTLGLILTQKMLWLNRCQGSMEICSFRAVLLQRLGVRPDTSESPVLCIEVKILSPFSRTLSAGL